jgi:hypothetical protein
MPRPGFYNDNEYRAYPFIFQPAATLTTSLVVDAGIVMGLDADFDPKQHSVWLHSVTRGATTITLQLRTDAPGAVETPLVFSRGVNDEQWTTEFAATSPADITVAPCAAEPIWHGFLTTGTLAAFTAVTPVNTTRTFAKNEYQLEPALIQNLAKSYLRSISVGNYSRTTIPPCGSVNSLVRPIVAHTQCMQGDIRLTEGYRCSIAQTDRSSTLTISAALTAGQFVDAGLCENGSELPLFEGESLAENSVFYSGGPACSELISTINGIGGRAVNIIGGSGVRITTTPDKITVTLDANSRNNCATEPAP